MNSTAALQHLIDEAQRLPSTTQRDVMRFTIAGYLIGALKYDPNQPRDDSGQWSNIGGGVDSGSGATGEELMSIPNLDDKEQTALADYKDSSTKINKDARNGVETETTHALDSAIQKSELTSRAVVLRGVNPNPERSPLPSRENDETGRIEFLDNYTGMEFYDSGFVSTTFSKDIASDFTIPGHAILFEIEVPKGSHALYVSGVKEYSGKDNEHELLLPRNTKYTVVGDTTSNGTRVIKVRAKTG